MRTLDQTAAWSRSLLLLLACASPTLAQEPASRAELLRQQRAAKSEELRPYVSSGFERAVLKIENDFLPRLVTPRSGFYPRLGSFAPGGGFGVGPGYRALGLADDRLDLYASAAYSYKEYWVVESIADLPRLAGGTLFARAYGRFSSLPRETFYGVGPESGRGDRVAFGLEQSTVGGVFGVRPRPWLRAGGELEWLAPDLVGTKSSSRPDVSERFDEAGAQGLASQPNYLRVGGRLDVDYARPFNPRRGGRYVLAVDRFIDGDGGASTFTRLDFDLQQYLSAFNERRVLALRAIGSFANPAGEATVPFYMMRTLGGDHTLRGFDQFRFRDRALLAFQAEYRFEILTALDGAVFYDTGQVASSRRGLALEDFERDYGVGLRVGTNAGVFVRFDVAFGSGEGTKAWLRFSHVF